MSFNCVGPLSLGGLFLLVHPSVVDNAAIVPLALSIPFTGSLSFHPAGFLSSAEPFLVPAFNLSCFLGPNSGFANSFVDSAAIVLPTLSFPSLELPSSTGLWLQSANELVKDLGLR
jgi:hypothetical protein